MEKLSVNPACQYAVLRRPACGICRMCRRDTVLVGPLDGLEMLVHVEYANLLFWARMDQYLESADPVHDCPARRIFGHVTACRDLRCSIRHVERAEQSNL